VSLSSSFEVGETSRGGHFEGPVVSLVAVMCVQAAGISFEGNMNGFLNLMAQVDKGQH
jgi:hypothetical protein